LARCPAICFVGGTAIAILYVTRVGDENNFSMKVEEGSI